MNRIALILAWSACVTLPLFAQEAPPPPAAALPPAATSDMPAQPNDDEARLADAWNLYVHDEKERALGICSQIIDAGTSGSTNAHFLRGIILADTGRAAQAIADFDYVLAADPGNGEVANAKAWILSTTKEDAVRNGKLALEIASRTVQANGRSDGASLDTLAAAYAETGDYENAIRTQEEALQRLGDSPAKEGATQRLELYRQGQPFRE